MGQALGDDFSDLTREILEELEKDLSVRYARFSVGLPFHGWHHIEFVRTRAVRLARKNGSNVRIVEAAALVHDLNYMVRKNSVAAAGEDMRSRILRELGLSRATIGKVEDTIRQAETEFRDAGASLEAQALSDADMIFKALPVTPVLLAHRYMEETGASLAELSRRINRDQVRLFDEGIYFYDRDTRDEYLGWAEANLNLWKAIEQSLASPEVRSLVALLADG